MPFQKPVAPVATAIPRVSVTISDRTEWDGEPASKTASYQLDVRDQNGRRMSYPFDTGDVIPHLPPVHIAAGIALIEYVRALAETNILEAE